MPTAEPDRLAAELMALAGDPSARAAMARTRRARARRSTPPGRCATIEAVLPRDRRPGEAARTRPGTESPSGGRRRRPPRDPRLLADSLGLGSRRIVRGVLRLEARAEPVRHVAARGSRRRRSDHRVPDVPVLAVRAPRRPDTHARCAVDTRDRAFASGPRHLPATDDDGGRGVDRRRASTSCSTRRTPTAGRDTCAWAGRPSAACRSPLGSRASRARCGCGHHARSRRTLARRDRDRDRGAPLLADPHVRDLLATSAQRRVCARRGRRNISAGATARPRSAIDAIAIDDDPAAGLAMFRLRRRGSAVEAGVSDVLVRDGDARAERQLLRTVARRTGADYAIRLGAPLPRVGFVPFPRQGPILTWRPLADRSAPPALRDLDLVAGRRRAPVSARSARGHRRCLRSGASRAVRERVRDGCALAARPKPRVGARRATSGALRTRGTRGARPARTRAEWARLEQQVRALPAPASSPRSISVVRLEFDGCALHPSARRSRRRSRVLPASVERVDPRQLARTPGRGRRRHERCGRRAARRTPIAPRAAGDAARRPGTGASVSASASPTARPYCRDRTREPSRRSRTNRLRCSARPPRASSSIGAAYEAASPVDGIHDIDLATFELCRRLRRERRHGDGRARRGRGRSPAGGVPARARRGGVDKLRRVARLRRGTRARADAARRSAPDGALRIALTVAAPSEKVAPRWGDWHLAQAFARALRRRGHVVARANARPRRRPRRPCVRRALSCARARRVCGEQQGRRHVLWIISHPESVTTEECDDADLVLVASARFADELRTRTRTPVEVLLQATDVTAVPPDAAPIPRTSTTSPWSPRAATCSARSVADAIAGGMRPAIYGSGWEPFVDPALVVERLRRRTKSSRSCTRRSGVLLNDHWQTMHEWGFVSNRLVRRARVRDAR